MEMNCHMCHKPKPLSTTPGWENLCLDCARYIFKANKCELLEGVTKCDFL